MCRSEEKRLALTAELRGPAGTNGTNGVDGIDGSLRIYGDGSSGPLLISTDTDWTVSPPTSAINYFTDLTVQAGATLTVPTGYVFRCTGNVSVLGTIRVVSSLPSDIRNRLSKVGFNPGISLASPAAQEQITDFSGTFYGPLGGKGMRNKVAAAALRPGLIMGGATSVAAGSIGAHSPGGGVLFILAKEAIKVHPSGQIFADGTAGDIGAGGGGAMFVIGKGDIIVNAGGSIKADGADGSIGTGGGGGGVLVLASATAVKNFGTVSSRGGNGSAPANSIRKNADTWFTDSGSGGGGGGGVIHFVSPSINAGVTNILGGTGGPSGTVGGPGNTVTTGGGGGGSFGDGGNSGTISVSVANKGLSLGTVESTPGLDGSPGVVIETPVDPTFSF